MILGIGSIGGYPKFPGGNGGHQGYLLGLGNATGYTNSISCSAVVCFLGVLTTGPPSKTVFFGVWSSAWWFFFQQSQDMNDMYIYIYWWLGSG